MRTLTLNNGSVLNDSYCYASDNTLWVYISNEYTLSQAFMLLSYPENTEHIVCNQYGVETVFDGYTHLYSITEETDGRISAGIKKGVQ